MKSWLAVLYVAYRFCINVYCINSSDVSWSFSVATHWYISGVLEAQFSRNGAGTVVSDAKYTTTRVRSMLLAVKMPRHFLFVFFCLTSPEFRREWRRERGIPLPKIINISMSRAGPNIQDLLAGPHQELRGCSAHRSRPGVGSHKTPSESVFDHIARLSEDTQAHQALRCHVDLTLGHPPEHSWKRRPGRANNRWIDQLHRDNNDTPPAGLWRRFTMRGHTGVTLRSSTTTHWQRWQGRGWSWN